MHMQNTHYSLIFRQIKLKIMCSKGLKNRHLYRPKPQCTHLHLSVKENLLKPLTRGSCKVRYIHTPSTQIHNIHMLNETTQEDHEIFLCHPPTWMCCASRSSRCITDEVVLGIHACQYKHWCNNVWPLALTAQHTVTSWPRSELVSAPTCFMPVCAMTLGDSIIL